MSPDRPTHRREIEDSTAARLAEIVAAAERAAKRVLDEAEAEARERLSDADAEADRIVAGRLARLAGLTDEVGAQAAELARRAEGLRRALAEAKAELGGDAAPRDPEAAEGGPADPDRERDVRRPESPALTVVGAPGAEARGPAAAPESSGGAAGARLLATQMAVAGASRAEIEARLRDGFAGADAAAILDAILGPEQ